MVQGKVYIISIHTIALECITLLLKNKVQYGMFSFVLYVVVLSQTLVFSGKVQYMSRVHNILIVRMLQRVYTIQHRGVTFTYKRGV